MLHRQEPTALVVISQPAHAWISGCIARAWGNDRFGTFAPKQEVCLGAEQHDIGWLLWETMPTLNPKTGYPHNFMEVPTEVHLGIWCNARQQALYYLWCNVKCIIGIVLKLVNQLCLKRFLLFEKCFH